MKLNLLIILFTSLTLQSFGQRDSSKFTSLTLKSFGQRDNSKNATYLKLSGGRVSFGTGDILGHSIAIDISKDVLKNPRSGISKLLIGGEFIFESGVKNPVIENPTREDFFSKTFAHTSNMIFWTKASYYPFKNAIKGFNIQLGPTFGYSNRSRESQARRETDIFGSSMRRSTLAFDNGFNVGYRISTGFEFDVSENYLLGFRLDFSGNTDAELNTLAGIKVGYKF